MGGVKHTLHLQYTNTYISASYKNKDTTKKINLSANKKNAYLCARKIIKQK